MNVPNSADRFLNEVTRHLLNLWGNIFRFNKIRISSLSELCATYCFL